MTTRKTAANPQRAPRATAATATPLPQPPAKRRGAQPGNRNAQTHGGYVAPEAPAITIEDAIAQLVECQQRITRALDEDALDPQTTLHAFGIMSSNTSRLGRLLRDQRALSGAAADGISGAIAQALDELSTELGIPL
jgi:hypothetical protein